MSHDSANDVKFNRENKSPEGKIVEILVLGVYKKPLLLREVRMIDRPILITLLGSGNKENNNVGVYIVNETS